MAKKKFQHPAIDVENRLAEMAMLAWNGQIEDVIDWLKKIGVLVREIEPGQSWSLLGGSGVVCGIYRDADPVTTAVQIAMAVIGPMWPVVLPTLLENVSSRWSRELKDRKSGG